MLKSKMIDRVIEMKVDDEALERLPCRTCAKCARAIKFEAEKAGRLRLVWLD
jgi:hypothetical protein